MLKKALASLQLRTMPSQNMNSAWTAKFALAIVFVLMITFPTRSLAQTPAPQKPPGQASPQPQNEETPPPIDSEPPPDRPGVSWSGDYTGWLMLSTTGDKIPLEMSFEMSFETAQPNDARILFWGKAQKMLCSFILDKEAGPFVFRTGYMDVVTKQLALYYSRTGSPSSADSLEFAGKMYETQTRKKANLETLISDLRYVGDVYSSSRGLIGAFNVTRNGIRTPNLIELEPRYIGTWAGTWADGKTPPLPLRINLASSENVQENPANMEMAFTPGYTGLMVFDKYEFPISDVIIDYLWGRAIITYKNPQTGQSLVLNGQIHYPDEFEGTGTSSGGVTGHFVLKRQTVPASTLTHRPYPWYSPCPETGSCNPF